MDLLTSISIVIAIQSLSRVWLSVTPWTAARQASLSITISRSLLRLMSIEFVMPSNHLTLCCPPVLLPCFLKSFLVWGVNCRLRKRHSALGWGGTAPLCWEGSEPRREGKTCSVLACLQEWMSWRGATNSDPGLGQTGDHDDARRVVRTPASISAGGEPGRALGLSHGAWLRVHDSSGAWKPVESS